MTVMFVAVWFARAILLPTYPTEPVHEPESTHEFF
jgi:hypothetical protein